MNTVQQLVFKLKQQEYLDALRKGEDLNSVPTEHQTYELCLEAVRNKGQALRSVPTEHQTYELCEAAR